MVYAEINGQVNVVLSQLCFKMFHVPHICGIQHNGILVYVNTRQLSSCMKQKLFT